MVRRNDEGCSASAASGLFTMPSNMVIALNREVNMKIGFFDSGVGGLSVLYEAIRQLPLEDYIYYSDEMNLPYGNKSKEEVRSYVFEAVNFMANKGIKALVIACNTATSAAINDIRRSFPFPVIGMEPAVKPAVKSVNGKRVLVFATCLTLRESKFIELLNKIDIMNSVDYVPLQELVSFAEKFQFEKEVIASYLKEQLKDYDLNHYGAVVLGCTHFYFFINHIKAFFPEDTVMVDGNKGTVRNLKNILSFTGRVNEGNGLVEYYKSGRKVSDTSAMNRYLDLLKQMEHAG